MTKIDPGTTVLPITRAELETAIDAADLGSLGLVSGLSPAAVDRLWAQLQRGRPRRPLRISLYEGAGGDHRWRIVAPNGETMEASEGYTRRHDARRGATTLMRSPMVLVAEDAPK
jgi:uncharacterized protein YegP (UPF0339 family)